MIKAILFDLDGTLLPMNQELFVKEYLISLTTYMSNYGYDSNSLLKHIIIATDLMISNSGNTTNQDVFNRYFESVYGEKVKKDVEIFNEYHTNQFNSLKSVCGYNKEAKNIINFCKEKGLKLVLATNPVYPFVATKNRLSWTDIDLNDFDLITSYENSYHCKPNTEYYKDILIQLNLKPNECLMIGNDVNEDMIALDLGIECFLLTNCLINKDNKDISKYRNGDYLDLLKFIKSVIK